METSRSRQEEDDERFLNSIPVGFKFNPNCKQLLYYLKLKTDGKELPPNRIREVQLYRYDPQTLTGMNNNRSFNGTRNEWYFFTRRERKYANGKRPNRQASDGFWKATGSDSLIKVRRKVIGSKRSLAYHRGKPPVGKKTNWLMHEYVLPEDPERKILIGNKDMQLHDWVLCRVYQKPEPEKGEHREGDGERETQTMENGVAAALDGSLQSKFDDVLNWLLNSEPDCPMPEYGNIKC